MPRPRSHLPHLPPTAGAHDGGTAAPLPLGSATAAASERHRWQGSHPTTHNGRITAASPCTQDLFFAEWQMRSQRLGEKLYPIFYPEVRLPAMCVTVAPMPASDDTLSPSPASSLSVRPTIRPRRQWRRKLRRWTRIVAKVRTHAQVGRVVASLIAPPDGTSQATSSAITRSSGRQTSARTRCARSRRWVGLLCAIAHSRRLCPLWQAMLEALGISDFAGGTSEKAKKKAPKVSVR